MIFWKRKQCPFFGVVLYKHGSLFVVTSHCVNRVRPLNSNCFLLKNSDSFGNFCMTGALVFGFPPLGKGFDFLTVLCLLLVLLLISFLDFILFLAW